QQRFQECGEAEATPRAQRPAARKERRSAAPYIGRRSPESIRRKPCQSWSLCLRRPERTVTANRFSRRRHAMSDYAELRERMVDRQIARRGLDDPRLLAAFRAVPREEFVSADYSNYAYQDAPLPIESGQTISQPYI